LRKGTYATMKGHWMLPVITDEVRQAMMAIANQDNVKAWQREMIHHLKEDNPEVNTLLLDLAQASNDPKAVVLAGYLVYKALELAAEEEDAQLPA
jgi:hypothetical protein